MKPLPINKAFKLYEILSPFLPDDVDDGFNFVGTIIENIKNSSNQRVYIEAIALMADMPFEEVLQYDPATEAPKLFAEGLLENDFTSLIGFCEKVGLNGWRS